MISLSQSVGQSQSACRNQSVAVYLARDVCALNLRCAVNMRLNYSELHGLLPGGSTQQIFCETTQFTPNMQPMSVRRQVPFTHP